jgi:hypothetical protein
MGKIQFATPEQELILDAVKQNNFLRANFYFTGGTALSYFICAIATRMVWIFFSKKN